MSGRSPKGEPALPAPAIVATAGVGKSQEQVSRLAANVSSPIFPAW
jgi:hypothetical protein